MNRRQLGSSRGTASVARQGRAPWRTWPAVIVGIAVGIVLPHQTYGQSVHARGCADERVDVLDARCGRSDSGQPEQPTRNTRALTLSPIRAWLIGRHTG